MSNNFCSEETFLFKRKKSISNGRDTLFFLILILDGINEG